MTRLASFLAPLLVAASMGFSLWGLHRSEGLQAAAVEAQQASLAAQHRFVAAGNAWEIDAELTQLDQVRTLAGEATHWRTASLFLLMGASLFGVVLAIAHAIQLEREPDDSPLAAAPAFVPKA